MIDKRYFDDAEGLGKLEITSLVGGIIHPVTLVSYRPIGQCSSSYPSREFIEKEQKVIKEAEREFQRIHKKYH
jgi:hypothetical protein